MKVIALIILLGLSTWGSAEPKPKPKPAACFKQLTAETIQFGTVIGGVCRLDGPVYRAPASAIKRRAHTWT